jgi:hypothetical protein
MMHHFSLDYKYWENILNRKLENDEIQLIDNAYYENEMNNSINNIYNNAIVHGLYIPILTPNDGNCLFHSLCYHLSIKDIKLLKKGIANIMILHKNIKNLIPNQELSLEELFPLYNELKFVFCYNKQKLYYYTYDAMCIDIMADDSWKRINTELLLTVLSIVLNLKFIIFHNNDHLTTICPIEKENTTYIYLAHINECHYIPLQLVQKNIKKLPKCLYYTECMNKFIEWGEIKLIENILNENISL